MDIDEQKFSEIYDQFAPKLLKFCFFRVGSKEEAEDVVVQVFINAWGHIVAGKRVTNVQGFLYRIANNLIVDFYRKNKDKKEISIDDPKNPIDVPVVSDVMEKIDIKILAGEMQKKLKALPNSYQEVIVMKYIQDLSVGEIAEILQTSENNISVRIHRALEKLKTL